MIKNKKQKNIFFSEIFFLKSRRASQVSFIISFALFISFLIFFIGVIKPFGKVETGKESLLKHLEENIIKYASEEVLVVSAIETAGGSKSCSDVIGLIGKNIFSEENGLIKIYSSDEFLSNNFQCDSTETYEIGLIRSQDYILESKFLKLNKSYSEDYSALKEDFGIPESNDFEFSFLNIDEIPIIETKYKETPPAEVLAELIPIIYLKENNGNAEIKNGYIKAVLW